MPRARWLPALALAALAPAALLTPAQPPQAPPPSVAWPMYGGSPGRNMVNAHDTNVLRGFDAEAGLPVRWKADLGSRIYAQPVVAGGRTMAATRGVAPCPTASRPSWTCPCCARMSSTTLTNGRSA